MSRALQKEKKFTEEKAVLYLAEVLYMALEHVPEGAEQVETARRLAKRIQGIELPLLLRRWHHEARWHVARVEGQQLSISAARSRPRATPS